MTSQPAVRADGLGKTYRVPVRGAGVLAAARALVRRTYREVVAVHGVTFSIEEAEIVGFLGPNGAGKTTTLKMLAGLLRPTTGEARVLGRDPGRRDPELLRSITLVMGQKSQLAWDLPPADTFELHRVVYDLSPSAYAESRAELDALLGLGGLLDKPVRQLSLGERMRCELALALLHRPKVLFLDEPTIGLDVALKAHVRRFLKTYAAKHRATILLTSHDMDDVTALAERVVVVERGTVSFDGRIAELSRRIAPEKVVSLELERALTGDEREALAGLGGVPTTEAETVRLRVPRAAVRGVVSRALEALPVRDLTVTDPPLEDVLATLFEREPA